MHAVEDAVAEFDFLFAQVGDGFKFAAAFAAAWGMAAEFRRN